MLPGIRSPLGAPGVFALPDAPPPALRAQRMDICAFVGVAPRGPAWQPAPDDQRVTGHALLDADRVPLRRCVAVPVASFDEYRYHYGGFEGPGALPHAVAAFFEQGGRQAWIVRVMHAEAGRALPDGRAIGELPAGRPFLDALPLLARNPGGWGARLRVQAGFSATPLTFTRDAGEICIEPGTPLAPGDLLRFTDALGGQSLHFCEGLATPEFVDVAAGTPLARRPSRRRLLRLDVAAPADARRMERVEVWLAIDDGAGRVERFERLALDPAHPNGLANVLCDRSTLLWPHPAWAAQRLRPVDARVELASGASAPFTVVVSDESAYGAIVPEDFFDAHWSPAEDAPGEGVACLAGVAGITHLLAPDLYVPAQWARASVPGDAGGGAAGAEFAPCVDMTPAGEAIDNHPPLALTGLILDPRTATGLDEIIRLQQRLVEFCEDGAALIALLDVPPDLSQARIEAWRARFDSAWAAAYHPWLHVARRDPAEPRRARPPSAVAAGIIAQRELERGIQHGPANVVARQVIGLAEALPEGRADALHPLGINCFQRDPEGIRLIAARTLSRARDWRQLSVRRLMLMLRRILAEDTRWAVFEPNGPRLWRDLRHAIESLLRGLYRAGAFVGRNEAEAFFVRLHTETARVDRGELLVEIGVAPAEPLEFIIVRLRRDGDGTLSLEE